MILHWGMVLAVYPFWGEVALRTSRLLRLQGSAAAAHIQRRIREQYGERETVSRAGRRVLRSYGDWGVLKGSGARGVYAARAPSRRGRSPARRLAGGSLPPRPGHGRGSTEGDPGEPGTFPLFGSSRCPPTAWEPCRPGSIFSAKVWTMTS